LPERVKFKWRLSACQEITLLQSQTGEFRFEEGAVDVKNWAGLRFLVQQAFCSVKFE
jgi:hypothetical protein